MAPWRDYTLIGVHSRIYSGDPFDLTVTESEVQGFIDEVREACPALGVARQDVVVVNAGLLPFGENDPDSKDLSFGKRSVLVDHGAQGGPDGLFSGMSVRWTMGRLLAEKTVDQIAAKLNKTGARCATVSTPVHGGAFDDRGELIRSISGRAGAAVSQGAVAHLADTFGALWSDVLKHPEGCSLLPDADVFAGGVRHAARSEMAVTLNDILLRRLDLGTGATLNFETLEACARIAGEELGWNDQRRRSEIRNVSQSYPFANPVSQQYLSS